MINLLKLKSLFYFLANDKVKYRKCKFSSKELSKFSFKKEKKNAVLMTVNLTHYDIKRSLKYSKSGEVDLNGKYHFTDMEQIVYFKNGLTHRDDNLPAVIDKFGSVFYEVNGKYHRLTGPAIIYSDGDYCWYINGIFIYNDEMDFWLEENNIPIDWNLWSDNDKMVFAMHWSDYN